MKPRRTDGSTLALHLRNCMGTCRKLYTEMYLTLTITLPYQGRSIVLY